MHTMHTMHITYHVSRCIASTITATTAEVAAVTPSMFTVILLVLRCCCYTSHNFYGGGGRNQYTVMESNDTQKVPMRIHQATTTGIQANNVKDNYALTIRKYQSAVLPIPTRPYCISEEEAVKGGSYDFAQMLMILEFSNELRGQNAIY